jgi:hypothetical protein
VEVAAEGKFLRKSLANPALADLLREGRSIGVAIDDLPDPSAGFLKETVQSEEAADDDNQNRGFFSAIYNFFNTSRKVIFSKFFYVNKSVNKLSYTFYSLPCINNFLHRRVFWLYAFNYIQ